MAKNPNSAVDRMECSANKFAEFKGAVLVPGKDRRGADVTYVDLLFDHPKHLRLFDPGLNVRSRGIQGTRLLWLFDSLGGDFKQLPACLGGWEEFAPLLVRHLNTFGGYLYMKLTLNENEYFELGSGRCFSKNPDMEYSKEDLRFLTHEDSPVNN